VGGVNETLSRALPGTTELMAGEVEVTACAVVITTVRPAMDIAKVAVMLTHTRRTPGSRSREEDGAEISLMTEHPPVCHHLNTARVNLCNQSNCRGELLQPAQIRTGGAN